MAFTVYLDETGDHTLELVDKEFPIFVLVMVICDNDNYIHSIVPAIYRLKFDFFGHEGAILHSRPSEQSPRRKVSSKDGEQSSHAARRSPSACDAVQIGLLRVQATLLSSYTQPTPQSVIREAGDCNV